MNKHMIILCSFLCFSYLNAEKMTNVALEPGILLAGEDLRKIQNEYYLRIINQIRESGFDVSKSDDPEALPHLAIGWDQNRTVVFELVGITDSPSDVIKISQIILENSKHTNIQKINIYSYKSIHKIINSSDKSVTLAKVGKVAEITLYCSLPGK